jgi:hypothetical protein
MCKNYRKYGKIDTTPSFQKRKCGHGKLRFLPA